MSRYIDADKFMGELNDAQIEFDENYKGLGKAKAMLSVQPTADVVEVVRCKDCKYCFHYIRPNYERYECEYSGTSDEVVDYVQPTHYCSHGERREKNAQHLSE